MSKALSPNESHREARQCKHCDTTFIASSDESFCCAGCDGAYQLINGAGLGDYYRMRESYREGPAAISPPPFSASYEYLDHPGTTARFVTALDISEHRATLRVGGITCAACLWLIEKLPELVPGTIRAEARIGTGVVTVDYHPGTCKLSDIARALAQLGYPMLSHDQSDTLDPASSRRELLRIGVSAVCSANLMMLAVSLFEEQSMAAEPGYRSLFQWLSLGISLPVITFCAAPFYVTSRAALKSRTLHIDLPITAAILVAFVWSVWVTLTGGARVYFDSLATLIFLLLGARFVQRRGVERARSGASVLRALTPETARRIRDGETQEVPASTLSVGDVVEVRGEERLPADGVVSSGEAELDASLLTGESRPLGIGPGAEVFAGTRLVSGTINITVRAVGQDSRVGSLATLIDESSATRAPLLDLSERWAERFVVVVFAAALATFVWWAPYDLASAIENTVALLIVTCPCALGLGTPLALSLFNARAASCGALFRGSGAAQRLAEVEALAFDKTGTLTSLALTNVVVPGYPSTAETTAIRSAVRGLELSTTHPIANVLHAAWANTPPARVDERREIPGAGVEGRIGEDCWQVGSRRWLRKIVGVEDAQRNAPASPETRVYVARNGDLVAELSFAHTLLTDARRNLEALESLGLQLHMLSGDDRAIALRVAEDLDISAERCRAELSPESKVQVLRSIPQRVAMVGDGANDAAAFAASYLGIAVHGSADVSLRVSDLYISRDHLRLLPKLIISARHCIRIIHTNMAIAAAYNALAGGLAIAGLMNPLLAAILMPVSSTTVLVSSLRAGADLRENPKDKQ